MLLNTQLQYEEGLVSLLCDDALRADTMFPIHVIVVFVPPLGDKESPECEVVMHPCSSGRPGSCLETLEGKSKVIRRQERQLGAGVRTRKGEQVVSN